MDAVAELPWWLGATLAVIAYLVLHHYASAEIAPTAVGDQIGRAFVSVMQYVIPLALTLGAVLSLIEQLKRRRLNKETAMAPKSAIARMSWQEFELAVAEAFRRDGYTVEQRGGNAPDGGVDLILERDHERYPVQCKHWRANRVGVPVIRELYGVMAAQRAAGGFVVTSGTFTKEARQFAAGREIELIDGSQLSTMFRQQSPKAAASPRSKGSPACPECGKPMVKRTARRGARSGEQFWGCSEFPRCYGKRPA